MPASQRDGAAGRRRRLPWRSVVLVGILIVAAGCGGDATADAPIAPSSRGVPEGTVLRPSGAITVDTPGAVIDGLDIEGTVTINANDVVLRNSRVRFAAPNGVAVAEDVTGARIEDVTIVGSGEGTGVYGLRGPATVRRVDISGVDNGAIPYSGSLIEDSHIHDLAAGGPDPHYDGIEVYGGSDITIRGNTIDLTGHDQTSTVMIANDFAPVRDVLVEGNRLLGGGYTVYSRGEKHPDRPVDNIAFIDNRMGRGFWGYASIEATTNLTWRGNVDDTTGEPVS